MRLDLGRWGSAGVCRLQVQAATRALLSMDQANPPHQNAAPWPAPRATEADMLQLSGITCLDTLQEALLGGLSNKNPKVVVAALELIYNNIK